MSNVEDLIADPEIDGGADDLSLKRNISLNKSKRNQPYEWLQQIVDERFRVKNNSKEIRGQHWTSAF